MEKRIIDPEHWDRREYFEHFAALDDPFFDITVETDVTRLYDRAKAGNDWFYARYLHAVLRAVNEIEELRYRIDGQGRIVLFDRIHLSPTVGREDGTFGFGRFDYAPDYETFRLGAQRETDRVQAGTGLMKRSGPMRINTIHSTALPWLRFSSLAHPGGRGHRHGIVSMATGKVENRNGRRTMPLQFSIHHGFADGRHAGLLFEKIQRYFDE